MNVNTYDAKPLHEEVLNLSKEVRVIPVDKDVVIDAVGSMDFRGVVVSEYTVDGYHREIEYNPVTKWYTVYDHREAVGGTMFATTAAEMYNGIKPREE